ncbi:alpha-hydroxy-acid oxidizing protein [Luteolibacter flavescens]|uniref:Alpha-hydroxy-acid oxidizing protein n=1 Tax=Luteolibacter flavescens TaxID=1859460 RepID=A0ABT3FVF2_9BACT|nr:alpha-hydroxy acid oxidase [Luteolibacter flavescens]MCW1887555.1 alpha-hydroxy-acid oxidizing protein [Luteolibacter flavescens]
MQLPPPLETIPPEIASVEDYEALARERLPASVWAYLNGGSADELAMRANREALLRIKVLPRLLRPMQGAHTRLTLLGTELAHPVIIAPTAFHRMFHPEGELATALGAAATESPMVVSTSATHTLEDIAATSRTPLWFQLYIQPDREFTIALAQRAEAAGYKALVLTADAPLNGLRNREQRAGFSLPPGIEAVNMKGVRAFPPADRVFGSDLLDRAPVWEDIAWLRSHTSLPIILKGVLHPEDAELAIQAGASGIIVSNHGGRTLDIVPAALHALPAIVKKVAGRVPVLMDGGIRRGSDAFIAIAMGADAVLCGRPVVHGLAAAGAVGVAHVLKLLRTELEMTMALAGCRTLAEIRNASLTFAP